MLRTDSFTPARFLSEGCIEVHGQKIPYHTVSEDTVFYDEDGKAIASMFSYSYFRSDIADVRRRPVVFCFNGGPSASSMMLHVGFVGPIRLKYSSDPDSDHTPLPPFESRENEYCLLDEADLVLIDPVGAGFGRLLDPTKADCFYGIEADAEAFLTLIQKWLDRYNRWESPKYLMGESYGCTRAATMAGMASLGGNGRAFALSFDGLILIGNTVTEGRHLFDHRPVYSAVTSFPSLAAVHWYHNHPSRQPLEAFVREAAAWAGTEYLTALFQGEALPPETRERIVQMLMYYTGVSREYIESRNLMMEDAVFRSQVIRKKGRAVSRLDGRITRPLYQPTAAEPGNGGRDDPAEGKYDPFFQAVLLGEVFPRLNIRWDRNFISSARHYPIWNNNLKGRTSAACISDCMRRVPGMRLFFLNGWYDLCTETGVLWYTMNHSGFPKDRTFFKGYEAGHMIYLGEEQLRLVTEDIRVFLTGNAPQN